MAGLGRIMMAAALLGLAACSAEPWTLGKSPDAITLRWYEDDATLAAANRIAAQHCRSWGKTAELATSSRAGSAVFVRYDCRSPPAPGASIQSRRYG